MLVENYHQFPSALNFGSLPQFFAPFRGQHNSKRRTGGCALDFECVAVGRFSASFAVQLQSLSRRDTSCSGSQRAPETPARHYLEITFKGPPVFACIGKVGHRLRTSYLNLPGWRWGTITQIPLVAVSRPLHSGVCETRQDAGLPVLHSEISDSGLLRTRGDQQNESEVRAAWV